MHTQSHRHFRLSQRRHTVGSTLIELMVSLLIALSVVVVVFQMYLASQKNLAYITELSALQNRTRLLYDLLRNSIQQAGYTGCGQYYWPFPVIDTHPDPESKIHSDTLTLWHASVESVLLARRMRGHGVFYLPNTFLVFPQDQLLITNCSHTEIITVKSVSQALHQQFKIIPMRALTYLYDVNAEIHILERDTYFVGETERGVDTLFVRSLNGDKDEVAEYVNQMQIMHKDHDRLSVKFNLATHSFYKIIFLDVELKNA
ncbi:MAG: hypothetical protein SFW66_02400 [Gammaproteobacteria bacterium]|nr:hypothetical protein [Gammaproteobacteria bacterium]